MLCRMPTIHFFRRGPRLSDSLGQVRIVVFEVMRKGRKRGDKGTFIDWLAVKPLAPIRCFADQNDIGFSADEYGYALPHENTIVNCKNPDLEIQSQNLARALHNFIDWD